MTDSIIKVNRGIEQTKRSELRKEQGEKVRERFRIFANLEEEKN